MLVLTVQIVFGDELYDQSEFWPWFTSLTENVQVDGRELKTGERGVLIRLTDEGESALVDFGRLGIYNIETKSTNIAIETQKLKNGEVTKGQPNLITLLHPRLIKVENSKKRRSLFKDISEIESFMCIRFPNTPEAWEMVSQKIKLIQEEIKARPSELILFPVGPDFLSDEDMFSRMQEYDILEANYMYDFLAQSYIKILWHDLQITDDSLQIAVFDLDGKLLDYHIFPIK